MYVFCKSRSQLMDDSCEERQRKGASAEVAVANQPTNQASVTVWAESLIDSKQSLLKLDYSSSLELIII